MWRKEIIYIDCEEEEPKEQEPLQVDEMEVITPTISCHALAGISTPQTLNIEGYIKKKKVIGNKLPFQTMLPELDEEGKINLEPEETTKIRTRQLRNRSILESRVSH